MGLENSSGLGDAGSNNYHLSSETQKELIDRIHDAFYGHAPLTPEYQEAMMGIENIAVQSSEVVPVI